MSLIDEPYGQEPRRDNGSIRADAGRTGRQIRGRPPRLLLSRELSNPRPERGVPPCAAPGVVPGAGRPRPVAPPPLEAAPRMAPRIRFKIGMTSLVSVRCESGRRNAGGPSLDLADVPETDMAQTLGRDGYRVTVPPGWCSSHALFRGQRERRHRPRRERRCTRRSSSSRSAPSSTRTTPLDGCGHAQRARPTHPVQRAAASSVPAR